MEEPFLINEIDEVGEESARSVIFRDILRLLIIFLGMFTENALAGCLHSNK